MPLIEEYERALEECADNHDDIDYDIAKAAEDLAEARPAGKEAARKKLARLKLKEAFQIYWLYAATWLTPILLGVGLYAFVLPSAQ